MKKSIILCLTFHILAMAPLHAQTPIFEPEIPVTINGWPCDAMQRFNIA